MGFAEQSAIHAGEPFRRDAWRWFLLVRLWLHRKLDDARIDGMHSATVTAHVENWADGSATPCSRALPSPTTTRSSLRSRLPSAVCPA